MENFCLVIIAICVIGGAALFFSFVATVCGLIVWACVLYLSQETWWTAPGPFFIGLVCIILVVMFGLVGAVMGVGAIVCTVLFGGLVLCSPLIMIAACVSTKEGGGPPLRISYKIYPISSTIDVDQV